MRLIVDSDSKDFEHGYHMGVDALEEISKATKAGDAQHEPLVMVGQAYSNYRMCLSKLRWSWERVRNDSSRRQLCT